MKKLKLSDDVNIIEVSEDFHFSNHPKEYHEELFDKLNNLDKLANGDTEKFAEGIKNIGKRVLKNADKLSKGGRGR